MKKILLLVIIITPVLFTVSCSRLNDKFDTLLSNPNLATTGAGDADLYLNNLLLSFENFHRGVSDLTDPLVRQQTMFGPTYFNAYSAGSFDGVWTNAYTSIFKTANTMIPIAEAKGQYIHSGIGKVLKAFTLFTLVDLFGDVPYSEANLGVDNTNPAADNDEDVYAAAINLLDSAISTLGQTAASRPTNDLFYAGSAAKWITLAKTLKLRAYVQTRLVDAGAKDKINAILAEGDIIKTASQDFSFFYGTRTQAPDSRDGRYVGNYGTDNGAGAYIGTYAMWVCAKEKGFMDPRTRYYFYRQCISPTDYSDSRLNDQTKLQFALACYFRAFPPNYPATSPYCVLPGGWWGRDHGNNEGIGADGLVKTTWGVYPAAGAFDADQNTSVGQSSGRETGAKGAGMEPIWLSSFSLFLQAEAALTLGTTGDAEALLVSAISASFDKVEAFPATINYGLPTSDTAFLITPYKKQSYIDYVVKQYRAAATTDAKLNIIEKEYYIAAWGNGLETYNNYRRTAKPDNFQLAIIPDPGLFIRSFFYPSVYVNFNQKVKQKDATNVKVFWDINPDNLYH
ncbi:SusD/RagB family nutrient-binding outer membrane lipoprotein [Foetidibacter luteolus]|uniref:SusD/RagB family nutrient-binding outer membrane lipoprotein n=1 Tax=Foetidibacter luteolus TaxID=2608880 RepID=UPI00129A2324|nr:SusD/RagB family nutrient-binding outer membrane lipoprotein [Foetidibacter luteolus]